jgi:hypothetical protein
MSTSYLTATACSGETLVHGPGVHSAGATVSLFAQRIFRLMKPRGIYRERNGWHGQHCVRVKYDERQELDVPEDRYRERGYQPPFDELPWKDDAANDV